MVEKGESTKTKRGCATRINEGRQTTSVLKFVKAHTGTSLASVASVAATSRVERIAGAPRTSFGLARCAMAATSNHYQYSG